MHTITEEMDEGFYICQGMFPVNSSSENKIEDIKEKLFYCMRQVALTGIWFCVTGKVSIDSDTAKVTIKDSRSDNFWCNPEPLKSQCSGIDEFLGSYGKTG